METATAREFNQNSSRILAAVETGETITVTKNGRPVATVRPYEGDDIPPYPDRPLDDIDIPTLDLPTLTDEQIDDTLRQMGA